MRGGFNAIQQTLTPESSTVLTHAILEANRRNHAQTTSLHVAATLLSSPTGLLRQACIRSNSNSSHPLQYRALELCFSVALDRIPQKHNSARVGGPVDPPISNSLMAALKRAQAHQRRGGPEQQQQHPALLSVKVDLEQLVVSILDDPRVSRVMREASFSSPDVKAVIQLTRPELKVHDPNLYLNPRIIHDVSRPSLPGRGCNGGILSTSIECLNPVKGFMMPVPDLTMHVSENSNPLRRSSCCPHCTEKYVQELVKLEAEVKSDANAASLPTWLQNAKMHADDDLKGAANLAQIKAEDLNLRQRALELLKKWNQTCLQLHPSFHHNGSPERIIRSPISMTGYNPYISLLGASLVDCELPKSTPGSPVRSDLDLSLGPMKMAEVVQDNVRAARLNDFPGCNVDEIQGDVDSFKRLLKGLVEKVGWQTDAASAIASTIIQCKLGHRRKRVIGGKGDIWLLFSGPDRIGKNKMVSALSELLYGVAPIMITLGSRRYFGETGLNFRGKTVMDSIAEVVRRNPSSVIMLQDFDEADLLVKGSIKRAMERGRLTESHGREISLGNVIFVITSTWLPHQDKVSFTLNEEKLTFLASGGWQLRILVGDKTTGKRSPSLTNDDLERSLKQRKESDQGLSFDLNQLADNDEDRLDESHNSSDLTVEHEEEHMSPALNDLLDCVDEAITFKPVDFAPIQHNIERAISSKFLTILGDNLSIQIESEALEKILSGIWLGQTKLESWVEKVLVPSIEQLKTTLPWVIARPPDKEMSIQLELDKEGGSRELGDWLPSRISVVTNTL